MGARGRHRGDDLLGPRRLRAPRRGARRARLRRTQTPPRADLERLVGRRHPGTARARHSLRPELRYAPDMVWVAGATGRPIEEVAEVFFAVGAELRLDWIEGELDRIPAPTRMQRWALQAVREDAAQMRRELAGSRPRGSGRRRRGLPGGPQRGAAALHVVPALARPRRRTGPGRAHLCGPPVARTRRLTPWSLSLPPLPWVDT